MMYLVGFIVTWLLGAVIGHVLWSKEHTEPIDFEISFCLTFAAVLAAFLWPLTLPSAAVAGIVWWVHR